jgi:hypothetical protein
MGASSSGLMKSLFISALALAACSPEEADLAPPVGMHTLTVIGGGLSYCNDGRPCPAVGTCLDNSFCQQHAATTTLDPAGTSCRLTGPCYAEGTSVHVSITGGGTSTCKTLVCTVTPSMQTGCDLSLVMDADYEVAVTCSN